MERTANETNTNRTVVYVLQKIVYLLLLILQRDLFKWMRIVK